MVPGVDEILRIINDLHRRAAIDRQLDAVLGGQGVLDDLLGAVRMDDDRHSAGLYIGDRNFHLGVAGILGQLHLDGGGGAGITGGLDLHGSLHRLAGLLCVLDGLAAESGLRRGLTVFVGLDGADGAVSGLDLGDGAAVGIGGGLSDGAILLGLGLDLGAVLLGLSLNLGAVGFGGGRRIGLAAATAGAAGAAAPARGTAPAAAGFLHRCQRNGCLGLGVFGICGLDRFDLNFADASYRNLTVGIHCCGAADDLPCDRPCTGTAGGRQGKGVPVVDGSGLAGDGKSRLLCLTHGKCIGFGRFSAIADGDSFSAMPGNGQHRALGGIGGQLVGVPANGFAGVVSIAYLHRQAVQIQRLAAGVGQLGGLGLDGNAADLFFGGGNCHACADGFRIVGGGRHLCKEVVGGICGQAGECFLCLPLTGGCVGGIHAVADCCAGVAGFYLSLLQGDLRGAVRLPGKGDLIRSRAYLHCKVLLYRVIVAATIFVVSSREGVLSYIANRSI